MTTRFRPTRAGIINLWDYRDEEFVFSDGWLVLRGPNGSGKTKALEVLFPFVLDGRIEPRRLNPFAGIERTMKSNLLYRGQETAHSYVWLEFGDGESHVTVGVGLRAKRHDDAVTRWYFVADGRVGQDFSLLSQDDRPLTQKQLAERIGAGNVRKTGEEHRAAVDARLYGLGPQRYEQLLTLVLTLRRPQLAKEINPDKLSDTLRDGLRPLDDKLLTGAARSFDELAAVQRTLDGMIAADEATQTFLGIYVTYLRTHARVASDALTSRRARAALAREDRDNAAAELRTAASARENAIGELTRASQEPERLRAELDGLKASDRYKSVDQLAERERFLRGLHDQTEQARHRMKSAEAAHAARQREHHKAKEAVGEHASEASRQSATLATDADEAGIAWTVSDAEPHDLTVRAVARVAARNDDIKVVRKAQAKVTENERDLHRAREARDEAQDRLSTAEQAEQAALAAVDAARDQVLARLEDWSVSHSGARELLGSPDLMPSLCEAVTGLGSTETPELPTLYTTAAEPSRTRLHNTQATAQARQSIVDKTAKEARAQRDRIAAEQDQAPGALPFRAASRQDRRGAPLWQLVDFDPRLDAAQAAGIEAALEAAGLLDAWIYPDDSHPVRDEDDAFLAPLPSHLRPTGRTLASLLVSEKQKHVTAQRIQAILASVTVTDEITVSSTPQVSFGGSFAQGIQLGTHKKAAAEFIGATARAKRRLQRLEELDSTLAGLEQELATLDDQIRQSARSLSAISQAGKDLPATAPVRAAIRTHDQTLSVIKVRREAMERASEAFDNFTAELTTARRLLQQAVGERNLTAADLDGVSAAVNRFEKGTERLAGIYRALATARIRAQDTASLMAEALESLEAAAEVHTLAEDRHRDESTALETLRRNIGGDAAAVLAEIGVKDAAIGTAEKALKAAQAAHLVAAQRHARAEQSIDDTRAAYRTAVEEAQAEARKLRPFAHSDLLALLRCPADLRWPAHLADWTAPAAVVDEGALELPDTVGRLHQALTTATKDLATSEVAASRAQTRLDKALNDLQTQLPEAGLDQRPEWRHDDGIVIVEVADENGLAPIKKFADRLSADRSEQETLLTESERRILEDTVLGQIARQIHQRTTEARDLVDAMDADMRARKMSSGLSVGIAWTMSDKLDAEQRVICHLLERDPAGLEPGDLQRMRRHFANRIRQAHAENPEISFQALLSTVLDYRRWRTFTLRLSRPGQKTEDLTKARHSQLSGGEQSVSLHLPLFAAAHALFRSARQGCPRMLALDEAFAGVDSKGRGELMALAGQFELDLFMTGYDLWANHPEVTGCAHYDLSHSAVDNSVSSVLMVWDGNANLADFDGSLAAALGSPGTRKIPRRELDPISAGSLDDD